MTTRSDIQAWAESTRPRDQYGRCAGLTDELIAHFTGGPRQWYDSATDARAASGGLNTDASACPAGGIHFWSYYGTAWDGSYGNWGHVAPDIDGGGGTIFSATRYARENWAVNAGLTSVAEQSTRTGMRYLGWARTYGAAAPLTITTDAGMPAGNEDDDMTTAQEVRTIVREEIGGALSAFAGAYKDQDWVREAVRQEIGGALSGFTDQIAAAVAERVKS